MAYKLGSIRSELLIENNKKHIKYKNNSNKKLYVLNNNSENEIHKVILIKNSAPTPYKSSNNLSAENI